MIGLFGTCAGSKWRQDFINNFEKNGIKYFNPEKADWKPEDARNEVKHLFSDDIIVIAILGTSFGTASLAEIGFCIVNAFRKGQKVIIFIEKSVEEFLAIENPRAAKESNNTRAIVLQHLSKIVNSNVFVVKSLEEAKVRAMKLSFDFGYTEKSPVEYLYI